MRLSSASPRQITSHQKAFFQHQQGRLVVGKRKKNQAMAQLAASLDFPGLAGGIGYRTLQSSLKGLKEVTREGTNAITIGKGLALNFKRYSRISVNKIVGTKSLSCSTFGTFILSTYSIDSDFPLFLSVFDTASRPFKCTIFPLLWINRSSCIGQLQETGQLLSTGIGTTTNLLFALFTAWPYLNRSSCFQLAQSVRWSQV